MASPVVEISDGKLRGREWKIVTGEKVLAFLGIPYGKAPEGKLRFKAPLPAEPWEGIRDATKDGNPCYGKDTLTQTTKGAEDCLFLNVYTKSLKKDKLRPVMVFIHGGAFVQGSSSSELYNPDYLLMEDVILVTINYRVGILGFLSLPDPTLEIPGNAGLKDQVLALKWVQKNIENFGGDPNNVTIFGESAGGASVHFHVLSPASKGLFHKGIIQSGTVHNPWPYGTAKLVDVLAVSGIQAKDEESAFERIKTLPVEELHDIQLKFILHKRTVLRVFGPVVEKPNPTAFLTKEPVDIIASGNYNKVPLVVGYCDKESVIFDSEKYKQMSGLPKEWNPTIDERVAIYLGMDRNSDLFKILMKKYEEFYLTSGMKDGKILLTSDILFIDGIITSAKLHAVTSSTPVYLYRLSIETKLNVFKMISNQPDVKGASHGDDLTYIFRPKLPNVPEISLEKDSVEEVAVKRIVRMWTDFAKYSNPSPPESDIGIRWPSMEKNTSHFLDINRELTVGTEPENERYPIWKEVEELYKKYNMKISGSA